MGLFKSPLSTLALYLLLSSSAFGAGDVMIHPTRIVFDKNQRSAKVDLTNTGAEIASFRISLEKKRMTSTGEFVTVTTPLPGENFADKFLQFSPRQVELAPGSGQTIRILLRKPANLEPGEYRAQLVFTRLPNSSANSVNDDDRAKNEIGIHLTALVGVSIPIIIENGETSASATLSDLKLKPAAANEPAALEFKINRTGNRSLYGDLTAKFVDSSGSEQIVAESKGVAVYNPNPFRIARMYLRPQSGTALQKGTLRLEYTETREAGGKPLAQAKLDLP